MNRMIAIGLTLLMVFALIGSVHASWGWGIIKIGKQNDKHFCGMPHGQGTGGGGTLYKPPKCTANHLSVQGLMDCKCPKKQKV